MQKASQQVEVRHLPIITWRWCFIDGSWKDKETYSEQGWYSTLEGFDGLIGEKHSGKSLTSTFVDGSADMGNGVYEELTPVSGHVCYRLFSIGEDGFRTRRMTGVWKLSGRHKNFKNKFPQLWDHSCTSDG